MTTQNQIKNLTIFQDTSELLRNFYYIRSVSQLREVITKVSNYKIIGNGSNLLINPKTSKTIIKIAPFISIPKINNNQIKINAGLPVSQLLQLMQKYLLSGLEFTAGIPANIGGLIYMNFGCYQQEISTYIQKVQVMDSSGNIFWLSQAECEFGYRHSIFQKQNLIILQAIFNLVPSDIQHIKFQIRTYLQTRKKTQPLGQKTFGSIFKNPSQNSAGKILDELGYKGKNFGTLKIYEKHANFLINLGNSSFQDILSVIELIQKDVYQKTNILLEKEVQIIL